MLWLNQIAFLKAKRINDLAIFIKFKFSRGLTFMIIIGIHLSILFAKATRSTVRNLLIFNQS